MAPASSSPCSNSPDSACIVFFLAPYAPVSWPSFSSPNKPNVLLTESQNMLFLLLLPPPFTLVTPIPPSDLSLSSVLQNVYPDLSGRNVGLLLRRCIGQRASSCDDEGTTWFFSSCSGILELRRGIQASSCVGPGSAIFHSSCQGELWIGLHSLKGKLDLI